jgi:hypothetical protein
VVWFGDEHSAWRFEPGLPCDLVAIPAGDGEWMPVPRGGRLLGLPSPDSPEATLLCRGDKWLLEAPGSDLVSVSDGQVVTVASTSYRIWTSQGIEPTVDAAERRQLADVRLHLSISLDQEEVSGRLQIADAAFALPSRTYLHLLVLLGRLRHEDAARGISTAEAGWRYSDDISRSLLVETTALNLLIHRARQDIAKLGFEDPAELIQRRTMTKQLRIGIAPEHIVMTSL